MSFLTENLTSNGWLQIAVGVSIVTFFASLVAIPWLIIRLPEDYFQGRKRHFSKTRSYHPVIYLMIRIVKNALGLVLLIAGIAMLVLPGQGLLTMLIGLSMMDFPGKFQLERFLVSRRPIKKTIQWIRKKAHKPPLRFDEKDH